MRVFCILKMKFSEKIWMYLIQKRYLSRNSRGNSSTTAATFWCQYVQSTNNTHNKAIRREISKQSNYSGILDKWYSSTNEEQYDIDMKCSWFNDKTAIQRHTNTWSQLTMKYFSDNLALSTKCSCNIKEIVNIYFWAIMR